MAEERVDRPRKMVRRILFRVVKEYCLLIRVSEPT